MVRQCVQHYARDMRILVTAELDPRQRAQSHDRIRLALGSRAQAIRWLEITGDGGRLRLRAELIDGRRCELEGWNKDAGRGFERLLDRLRRSLSRTGTGVSPAPLAPPR